MPALSGGLIHYQKGALQMSENVADLQRLKSEVSADAVAGPWNHSVLGTAQGVRDFANTSPVSPLGGLVVSRRPDGQFDVWWRS